MNKVKNVILALVSLSMLAGGIGQLITLNDTVAVYNAYFQMFIGFILFIWLAHKAISAAEVRVKPTNARDSKKK